MEGLPGWGISSMPGPPRRQHKHERRYIPGTHSVIPTRQIWNDDYGGQMIFGELVGLKFLDICLTGEEKPRKSITQETCPDRGSNPGPLRHMRTYYRLFHSGGLWSEQNLKKIGKDLRGQNMQLRRLDLANWAIRNSQQGLKISSISVFDQIRDPKIPITFAPINLIQILHSLYFMV